ncbi:hypothetical protein Tco_1364095 [Tanacetum coccineum]
MAVSDFISKCCLKEAFTRAPNQYKEYLSKTWYTAKVLSDSKIWVSTPTGEVRGDIDIITFRNALRAQYLPRSRYNGEIEAKGTLKKSCLPPRWRLLMGQIIQCLDVHVDSKAPKYSSPTEEKETKSNSAMDTSPSHTSPPTPVVGEMHKEAQQAAGGLTSLRDTSKDGAHFQLSSGSNPSFLVDKTKSAGDRLKTTHTQVHLLQSQKKELEHQKAAAEAEAASIKAKPSYPDINQLTTLLVTSLKPELSKLLASYDFASCLPTELQELPSKVTKLSEEIKELKQHVAELKNIQWEFPAKFLDLPHLVSSVQEKLKTLDSLPGLLKKVTNTLNRFATLVENTSGAIITGILSADKATTSPAEGEKDADTNLKNELVDLLGIDTVTQYYKKKLLYKRYCEKMKKRR